MMSEATRLPDDDRHRCKYREQRDALRNRVTELEARIVTTDIDGRTVRFDKVAEAEAALDTVEQDNERLREEVVALRATLADAPHADGCLAGGWLRSGVRGTCICWKSRVLSTPAPQGGE